MNIKMNKRILLISDRFFPETFLVNEIPPYLREQGFTVDVLTQNAAYPEGIIYQGERNPLFQITRMDGIRILRFKTIIGFRDSLVKKILNYLWFMFASSLWAFVSGFSYKYIFVYHVGTLTEALPLYIYKRFFGKRTSIWTQDIWPDSVFAFGFRRTSLRTHLLKFFVSAIYNSIDSIMVSSPGFVEKISEYVSSSKTPIFIPQWAPNELFLQERSTIVLDEGCINFVFAGNVGTQHNLERVMRAFEKVHSSILNVHLHIVGEGTQLKKLKDLANRFNFYYIHFHYRIPQSQILSLLYSSDACVLSLSPDPSIELTLPAKFQTYLLSERPILCVARGESKALVSHYKIGEIAEPDSIESIVVAISNICEYSQDQKRAIAERMLFLVSKLFNERESKRKILEGIVGFQVSMEIGSSPIVRELQ